MSAVEARSLGCSYDPMSFSWLAPACFDAHLTSQFLDARDWHWYHDPTLKREVNRSAVLAGEHERLYVPIDYHLYHCAFMWRKLHRTVVSKGVVDGYLWSYEHTVHCAGSLLGEGEHGMQEGQSVRPTVGVGIAKYPSCDPNSDGTGPGWYNVVNGTKVWGSSDDSSHLDISRRGLPASQPER